MDTLLFNLNDLFLIFSMVLAGAFAAILGFSNGGEANGRRFLAALLLAFSLQVLDTLIYWCEPIRQTIASLGAWPFFLFKWVPLVQGPLLYTYLIMLLSGEQGRHHYFHFLPAVFYPIWAWGIAIELGPENWALGLDNYGVWFSSKAFVLLLWMQKLSVLVYCVLCWRYLNSRSSALESVFSDPNRTYFPWLRLIVGGFTIIWGGYFLSGIAEVLCLPYWGHVVGISLNYLNFLFVSVLVIYSLSKSQIMVPSYADQVAIQPPARGSEEKDANRLEHILIHKELYLNPELTVEELAKSAGFTERHASTLINYYLGKTFFELVNEARIERAKELLVTKEWPVQRVFEESGFNSKASFNRVFKRYVCLTPSQYRKTHQNEEVG